jgi:hypothetical protein
MASRKAWPRGRHGLELPPPLGGMSTEGTGFSRQLTQSRTGSNHGNATRLTYRVSAVSSGLTCAVRHRRGTRRGRSGDVSASRQFNGSGRTEDLIFLLQHPLVLPVVPASLARMRRCAEE